jgi:hypothetical protein
MGKGKQSHDFKINIQAWHFPQWEIASSSSLNKQKFSYFAKLWEEGSHWDSAKEE